MILTRRLHRASILLTTVAFLLAGGADQPGMTAAALAAGWLGWVGLDSKQEWIHSAYLIGVGFLTTIGALASLPVLLLWVAWLSAIAAWDLNRFERRLRGYPPSDAFTTMERRHLKLLALFVLIGGILSLAALLIRAQLNFYIVLAMAVILVLSMGLLFRLLQSE